MAMNLVLAGATLVEESELEEGTHVGALAGKGDEYGDIGGVVLGVLAVRVEVNGPLVPSHREIVAGDVLTHANSFGQRVPSDGEVVGPIHGLGNGP